MKQVDKKHYLFSKYSFPGRWESYFYQLSEVLSLEPETILEVGVGDKVFGSFVKNNTSVEYSSMDCAEDLSPDIVGDLTSIPAGSSSFSVVCAFEVLEHVPFDSFEIILQEMKRVSQRYVVISVPHFGPPVQLFFKLPFLPPIRCSFKIPFYKRHVFNGEHYWEIGKKGYSPRYVRRIIEKHFKIRKEFIPFGNQYHHFYVLEK